MKQKPARRVFVTLELETDLPLAILRKREAWRALAGVKRRAGGRLEVLQASANVARNGTRPRV